MLYPIKVIDIELSRPIPTLEGLTGYMSVQALVRLDGVPLGYVKAPISQGCCAAEQLRELILEHHSWAITEELLKRGLAAPKPAALELEDLLNLPHPEYQGEMPLVTVAVCTRDRPADLAICLQALCQLDYPQLDLLVVDNAPTSSATEDLLKQYPQVRYVCEPRPGLDWARNRAILAAKGEIIAYTDDDAIVDSQCVKALAQVFAENPEVMAVTGLVVPYELETQAQVLFEMYGGFGRGFQTQWRKINPGSQLPWGWLGTGQFGTGANMAYRRCLFSEIGGFDPALDVGTVTNGGGDLEMFFRVLKEGRTLVYEPKAIVRHRHRRDYAKLRSQIANNSIGLFSYSIRSLMAYPDEWRSFLRLWIWWLVSWNLRRLWIGFKHPTRVPQDLVLAEFWGCFRGFTRYHQARRQAEQIANRENLPTLATDVAHPNLPSPLEPKSAVRLIDLSQPLAPIDDVADYSEVLVVVEREGQLLGNVKIPNLHQAIGVSRLSAAIGQQLNFNLLPSYWELNSHMRWAKMLSTLSQHFQPKTELAGSTQVVSNFSVSVVVATYDRPDDLRNCLRSLLAQNYPQPPEIIVVDNHPASGLTPPVVAEFPSVLLIKESRQGLSYARNAGIVASKGEIIAATDDDVTLPPHWLLNLVAPFARPDVMAVTGNVLPVELETPSQQLFELYGGLGRGFERLEVNSEWFESFPRQPVPTWTLGASANAAFRASIFHHPQIGLIEEMLGAGMPTGCSEDTYVFYKILKAGYTIVYEPQAYVWHKHRRELESLRRQIYNYSKGHVAYHLITWLRDRDWRGLIQLLVGLPLAHYYRFKGKWQGWSQYPLRLVLLEIAGNLAGPWALWQSYRRVRQVGRSSPYVPPSARSAASLVAETPLAESLPQFQE